MIDDPRSVLVHADINTCIQRCHAYRNSLGLYENIAILVQRELTTNFLSYLLKYVQ